LFASQPAQGSVADLRLRACHNGRSIIVMFNQPKGGDPVSHQNSSVSKGPGVSASSEQPLA